MSSWMFGVVAACLLCLASQTSAKTLAEIKSSGHFACGTVQNVDDWNGQDMHGDLSALETEICRAVAVALFGDDRGLAIQAFPGEPETFAALAADKIQLAVGVSPSAGLAMKHKLGYGHPIFFDSQRFLVDKQSGVASLAGLRDRLICALDMTPPERALRDEMTARGITYSLMTHSEQGEMDAAIAVHRCIGTALESRLAQSRANFHARVNDFVFLSDRLGIAPVAPAYRSSDAELGLIVDWTISALIEAEALGVNQANVASARARQDMLASQLLGGDFATAQAFDLPRDWAAKVIAATGNYGEIFERTVGRPYRLERGLNAQWTQGGLMSPLPMQ